jgi:hypothetical protein
VHSGRVSDSRNSDENRSQWRRVFLTVEAPGFTGFEPPRSRRNLAVFVAAMFATVFVIALLV